MKKQFNKIYIILLGIIIVGKLSNWFLNYSDKTNDLLNTVLFTLIGVGFVIESFTLYKKEFKLIFLICGIYLIAMNFIDNFQLKSLIGIVCTLLPILIKKFSSKFTSKTALTEN